MVGLKQIFLGYSMPLSIRPSSTMVGLKLNGKLIRNEEEQCPSSTMVGLKPIKGSYTADFAKSQKTSKSTGWLCSALEGLRFSVDLPGFSGYLRSTPMAELFV